MTANETKMCRLTARALRIMTAQDEAEAEGDLDMVCCLRLALGRLAEEAQRLTANIAEPAGQDMGEINRVVAALIPPETDEGMTIVRARSAWYVAHAEQCRTEVALGDAEILRDSQNSPNEFKAVARHIYSMREYAHAMLSMAEAELDLHLATMPPQQAADLLARLDFLEHREA